MVAEITYKLAANTSGQVFFATITTVSIRCLVENFQLICDSE